MIRSKPLHLVCRGRGTLPRVKVSDGLQGVGAPQQLVQEVDDVSEAWPLGPILEPALQHELVNGGGAVHGCR